MVQANAADEGAVHGAARRQKHVRERELRDLCLVLSSLEGRRFLFRLMAHCQVNGSVWGTPDRIYYNSGRQDVGHFIQAEIVSAHEESLFQMMRESSQEEKQNA